MQDSRQACWVDSEQPEADCPGDGLWQGAGIQLAAHVVEVEMHGAFAQGQPAGNFCGRQAFPQPGEAVQFAAGQRG